MDPQLTTDGKPYGPVRYKQIFQECFIISQNSNNSYKEILGITPLERGYMIDMLAEKARKTQEMLEESKQNIKHKK